MKNGIPQAAELPAGQTLATSMTNSGAVLPLMSWKEGDYRSRGAERTGWSTYKVPKGKALLVMVLAVVDEADAITSDPNELLEAMGWKFVGKPAEVPSADRR